VVSLKGEKRCKEDGCKIGERSSSRVKETSGGLRLYETRDDGKRGQGEKRGRTGKVDRGEIGKLSMVSGGKRRLLCTAK